MMLMVDVLKWLMPPEELRIEPREVHIWRAAERDHAASAGALLSILSADERARASQFHFDTDRRRYILCRGAVRQLLGRYTGQPAGAIEFSYGPYGKPALSGSQSLHFNLSHTRGLCLFAFSATLPVGIDVEAIDPARDWSATAGRFFHPGERAYLESLPRSRRDEAAYAVWTCKEACLKATGEGVGGGLEEFEVVPIERGGFGRVNMPGHSSAHEITFRSLDVGTGFAAALASVGRASQLRTWEFLVD